MRKQAAAEAASQALPGKIFVFLDADGDGQITSKEWHQAFTKLDKDHSETLSRQEWMSLGGDGKLFDRLTGDKKSVNHDEWMQAFQALDSDKNGAVSVLEFFSFC